MKWPHQHLHQQEHHIVTANSTNDNHDDNSNDDGDDDDGNVLNYNNNGVMILSRIDLEIQGIGRPRNRSKMEDQSLEDDYRNMMRRLSAFIHSAKVYHKSWQSMNAAKQKMSRSLEDLATGYPIADAVFTVQPPQGVEGKNDNEAETKSELNSLSQVLTDNANNNNSYSLKFQKKVIQYCIDWQLEVSSRVERAKKETKYLLARLAHYIKKVERLRQKATSSSTTALSSSTPDDPKLERNVGKLQAAWNAHEVKSTQFSYILQEVTVRGWKELYPLLKNILQLEWERVQVEFDRLVLVGLPEIEAQLDRLFHAACLKVTPVSVDYFAQQLQHQQQQLLQQTIVKEGSPSTMLSSSSDDDEEYDCQDDRDDDFIEVVLAPKNYYNKEMERNSASPRGISDIDYF